MKERTIMKEIKKEFNQAGLEIILASCLQKVEEAAFRAQMKPSELLELAAEEYRKQGALLELAAEEYKKWGA